MNPLIECVPNFSEGRRLEVIEAIADSIRAVSDVTLLDVSSDYDHNRTVITFVGSPVGVEQAAFAAIKTASEQIDMTQHQGEHPRIGATDVVPFIPIRDVQIGDCVAIAQRLGQRVGDDLGIPVYLYEKAAIRKGRKSLGTIRAGEYEGLREAIKTDPAREPDFGPSELDTPGPTVIGARVPLVAYNIYLNTDDVEAADKIAKSVRHLGGGLRFLKAIGLLVDGQAQISMNLTDVSRTPIHRVQELVKIEAARYGLQITHSELVGLIPEQALIDSARWYLQLDQFENDQILEHKLRKAEVGDMAPRAFINAVAGSSPTPGGGSVAALAGALASALAGMVAGLSIGKKKYKAIEAAMQEVAGIAGELQAGLTDIIIEDSAAFDDVMTAYRLNKDDPNRSDAIQSAMQHAADVPLRTARLSLDAMIQLQIVAAEGNSNAATDAAVGAQMALAAIEGASLNVLVNCGDIADETLVKSLREEVADLRQQGRELAAIIIKGVEERIGLT